MVIKMITIRYEKCDAQGNCTYRVQIKKNLICRFEHNSSEGPAECLQRAADAMKLTEWAEFEIMNDSKGG
ncbi:MAG: hypothetical protein ACI8PB_004442 [Desulforhopalus sp.]|jgi:hypothetical protein